MRRIKKSDIRKGFRFNWLGAYSMGYGGIYEVICYRKNLSQIFCYKPGRGEESTIGRDGRLAGFDERIIDNEDFVIAIVKSEAKAKAARINGKKGGRPKVVTS